MRVHWAIAWFCGTILIYPVTFFAAFCVAFAVGNPEIHEIWKGALIGLSPFFTAALLSAPLIPIVRRILDRITEPS